MPARHRPKAMKPPPRATKHELSCAACCPASKACRVTAEGRRTGLLVVRTSRARCSSSPRRLGLRRHARDRPRDRSRCAGRVRISDRPSRPLAGHRPASSSSSRRAGSAGMRASPAMASTPSASIPAASSSSRPPTRKTPSGRLRKPCAQACPRPSRAPSASSWISKQASACRSRPASRAARSCC